MKKILTSLLITLTLLGASFTTAEEMPQMSEEQAAMMASFQAYATPNENHALLAKLAGTWNTELTVWMAPGAEGESSTGVSTAEMTMDGKFLEQNYTSEFMGAPFSGRGIYGYDNIKKEFTGIWYDSMGTGIMISTSQYNPETMTINEEGSMSCPVTNSVRWHRAETTFIDDNHYTYTTYMKDENGVEFKSMFIDYIKEG